VHPRRNVVINDDVWRHIDRKHVTGDEGNGSLFSPGTTREMLQAAAEEICVEENRMKNLKRFKRFKKYIKVNRKWDCVIVIVDDNNSVHSIYPLGMGKRDCYSS
jgi:hypothetical protein